MYYFKPIHRWLGWLNVYTLLYIGSYFIPFRVLGLGVYWRLYLGSYFIFFKLLKGNQSTPRICGML